MTSTAPGVRLPWHPPTAGAVVLTVALVLVSAFSMTAAIAFATQDAESRGEGAAGYVAAWLVGSLVCFTLALRHRFPVAVCVVTSASALLLPVDSLAALIALVSVVAVRPWRVAVPAGALVAGATAAALARDAGRDGADIILSSVSSTTGERLVPSPVGFAAIGAVCVAIAVGAGLVRRSQRVAVAARTAERAHQHVAQELRSEMTRQEEREVIAREMHDTVAHHLSLVSLRAAALEVTAPDGAEVKDAARSMRSAAHQALEEMRQLIAVLRDPTPTGGLAGPGGPGRTLEDLPDLVERARAAGARIRSTVYVSDAAHAPAVLTLGVYRIVQEALTNAMKHAPGAEVVVELRAAPGHGVTLRVANVLPPSPATAAGAGAGLAGIRERASMLGGTVAAGVLEGWFLVDAWLPWPGPGLPQGSPADRRDASPDARGAGAGRLS